MKDELITFETAVLAKEKGFDVICWNFIDNEDKQSSAMGWIGDTFEEKFDNFQQWVKYYLPTQNLLQRWLREIHGIHIELVIDGWKDDNKVSGEYLCYRAFIWQVGHPKPTPQSDLGASDYERILEIALQEALNLIK